MQQVAGIDSARDVYSVSRLNREVRSMLESGFARLWVEGEISNLARPPSGHLYFSLKDATAQVSCALFRNNAARLGFTPENGMQVLVRAQVSLYEARGNYQLIVNHMEEAGDGALRRAFEQLKRRLYDAGLFDEAHKQGLPRLPQRIGIVTSPSGAAIRDVLTVLRRRFPAIPVVVYPVQVQGADAARQIVAALQTAERRAECDVLLLTRGGGSLEDLWPFNEEPVARAVYACGIPVVSAVGHEIDVVISDYVADQRAPTPSAAAELLSPDRQEIAAGLRHLHQRLLRCQQQHLQLARTRFEWLGGRLQQTHPGRRLQQRAQRLDELQLRLQRAHLNSTRQHRMRLEQCIRQLHRYSPGQQLQKLKGDVARLARQLDYCINIQLQKSRGALAGLTRALDTVSPLATLKRGYSITLRDDGSVLADSAQTTAGDTLETRLASGRVYSRVTGVKSK